MLNRVDGRAPPDRRKPDVAENFVLKSSAAEKAGFAIKLL
jgi:hypothetical protein